MLTINNVLINRIESQSLYEKLSTLPTIGDRLKFLRKDYLKKSRAKMANEMQIEPTTIQKYEENRTTPKISRLKEFADYFQLPVEVLTGEDADVMIMEDYFLIGNLQYFCWRIDFDRELSISEELLKQIKIAIYKANIEIVKLIKNQNDLIYVLKLFDLDDEDNSSTLIDLFEKNIQLVTKGDYNEDHQSIEKLSKVFDYAINTKNLIDKKTYNSIVNILYPLVECYKNNPE